TPSVISRQLSLNLRATPVRRSGSQSTRRTPSIRATSPRRAASATISVRIRLSRYGRSASAPRQRASTTAIAARIQRWSRERSIRKREGCHSCAACARLRSGDRVAGQKRDEPVDVAREKVGAARSPVDNSLIPRNRNSFAAGSYSLTKWNFDRTYLPTLPGRAPSRGPAILQNPAGVLTPARRLLLKKVPVLALLFLATVASASAQSTFKANFELRRPDTNGAVVHGSMTYDR